MGICERVETFYGGKVEDCDPGEKLGKTSGTIYRLTLEDAYDAEMRGEHLSDLLARLLDEPVAARATGLVIGTWEAAATDATGAERIVAALVAARDRLPSLRALFLGDITQEECEISWIQQTDVSPVLAAFPALECLRIRGGTGLVLGTPRHEALRELIVESGGLAAQVVRGILAGHLPRLEHLELWLGDQGYGATTTVEDLAPILEGTALPALRYLGLRNSDIADALADALAKAPIVGRIQTLDLSLGNLSDEGAKALLESPAVRSLRKLDLHHHYLSDTMVAALAGLGIDVDTGEQCEPDEYDGESYRYIAHAE